MRLCNEGIENEKLWLFCLFIFPCESVRNVTGFQQIILAVMTWGLDLESVSASGKFLLYSCFPMYGIEGMLD